jgi:hypothetical protein
VYTSRYSKISISISLLKNSSRVTVSCDISSGKMQYSVWLLALFIYLHVTEFHHIGAKLCSQTQIVGLSSSVHSLPLQSWLYKYIVFLIPKFHLFNNFNTLQLKNIARHFVCRVSQFQSEMTHMHKSKCFLNRRRYYFVKLKRDEVYVINQWPFDSYKNMLKKWIDQWFNWVFETKGIVNDTKWT